ncbi:MAG: peptidoglycan editing factor PgeF [Bacteroidetes bacterium]|jgi:YfiH family protein|nr:peptidoglycan editing factor PgeF [Bacteroidota bacterium]
MDPLKSSSRCYKPNLFNSFPNIVAAQSTRLGGVSPPPFESLNLGFFTNDHFQNVRENRIRFFSDLGFTEGEVVGSFQIHEDRILTAHEAKQYENYDAIITTEKNLLLTVTIADCVPVLIYDAEKEVVAAIHAGWRGTDAEIVRKTLEKMHYKYGSKGENCFAYIGTCIDESSFEVGNIVAKRFEASFKRWDETKQKFFVDLKKANEAQLLEFGLPKSQIEISPYSTVINNETYFSHRKENGQTGRMLAVIGMKNNP